MGIQLLRNPWVQFYLVYVAALVVACIWGSLRHPSPTENDTPTPIDSFAAANSTNRREYDDVTA